MEHDLENLLKQQENQKRERKIKKLYSPQVRHAAQWLYTFLCPHPKSANDIYEAAAEEGYSRHIIKQAKPLLRIYSRLGFCPVKNRNLWMWFLPNHKKIHIKNPDTNKYEVKWIIEEPTSDNDHRGSYQIL